MTIAVEPTSVEVPLTCSRCERALSFEAARDVNGVIYCEPCAVTRAPSWRHRGVAPPLPPAAASKANSPAPLDASERQRLWAIYVGDNWTEHYQAAFRQFADGGSRYHWNWAGCLVGAWAWHRKLYEYAALMLVAYMGVGAVPVFLILAFRQSAALAAIVFVGGLVAVTIYRGWSADWAVWEAANDAVYRATWFPTPAEREAYVRTQGGRTFWIYWVGIALIVLGALRGALSAGS